ARQALVRVAARRHRGLAAAAGPRRLRRARALTGQASQPAAATDFSSASDWAIICARSLLRQRRRVIHGQFIHRRSTTRRLVFHTGLWKTSATGAAKPSAADTANHSRNRGAVKLDSPTWRILPASRSSWNAPA